MTMSNARQGDDLSVAFHDLLGEIAAIEQKVLTADPPLEEADVLDGYRLTFSLLRVAVAEDGGDDADETPTQRDHEREGDKAAHHVGALARPPAARRGGSVPL